MANRWPAGALVMMGIGLMMLAAPTAVEGPVLDEEFSAPGALGGARHLRYRIQLEGPS